MQNVVASSVAEWSEAPSVEPIVVTGLYPALAQKYLSAVVMNLKKKKMFRVLPLIESILFKMMLEGGRWSI